MSVDATHALNLCVDVMPVTWRKRLSFHSNGENDIVAAVRINRDSSENDVTTVSDSVTAVRINRDSSENDVIV